jgi:hypothetical protein
MSKFDYLIEKINSIEISNDPFPHLYINNFFRNEHFVDLINAPEIRLSPQPDDAALLNKLANTGYKLVPFPGATTDQQQYIKSRKRKTSIEETRDTCEASGIVLRL